MLLPKEDTDYNLRTMQESTKHSSYMPPIKSTDKFKQQYYSPSHFQSTKRLAPFPYQQTPKRDLNQLKLDPLMNPYSPYNDKNANSGSKDGFDRFKSLSAANVKIKSNLRTLQNSTPTMGAMQYGESENRAENKNNEEEDTKKANDPLSTFQTFMNRLNKIQINGILPNAEPVKFSDKSYGLVRGFSVCTNQGLVRGYNEDRVSIILNISRPANKSVNDYWPNCSMFGVFDGHGGHKCADFLRNNLHQYIIKNKNFPWNPQEALKEAFEEADRDFLENVLIESDEGKYDKSGSCAIIVMFLDDMCYVCNVGDSRATISQNFGNSCYALSRDHKPCDKLEQKRVIDAGGKVYQNFPMGPNGKRMDLDPKNNPLNLQVPWRILPGRLSVSRSFGDIEAKMVRFGGNSNVLIAKPEITTLKITKEHDFIFLGCDGIFDRMSNEDVTNVAWSGWKGRRDLNVHAAMKIGVENIIKDSMIRKSLDNVTGILISFANLESFFESHEMGRKDIGAGIGMAGGFGNNTPVGRADHTEEPRFDPYKREGKESPLIMYKKEQMKESYLPKGGSFKNLGMLNIMNTNPVLSSVVTPSDPMKVRSPSRGNGNGIIHKAVNDMFDFSKFMDDNAKRRGSEARAKLLPQRASHKGM